MALGSVPTFKIGIIAENDLLASHNVSSRKTCNDLVLGIWDLGVWYTRVVEARLEEE